jgi:hypothetical protein
LVSLDAFRGATIAGMLLVNNPGSWSTVYPPLLHAPWHGWTFTDLIFPAFLWIVGVAMTLSFAKRVEAGGDTGELFRHVLRRSAIFFFPGPWMFWWKCFQIRMCNGPQGIPVKSMSKGKSRPVGSRRGIGESLWQMDSMPTPHTPRVSSKSPPFGPWI